MKGPGKKRVPKGEPGYIRSEKIRRSLITFVMFLIPVVIFVTGLVQTKTRLNLFTVVAILGCLPASRSAVGMLMMLPLKSAEEALCEKTRKAAGEGTALFELCFTAYEKNTLVDALVIGENQVIGFTRDKKADPAFLEKHLRTILKQNGCPGSVKIFREEKPFLERAAALKRNAEKKGGAGPKAGEGTARIRAVLLQVAL